MRIVILLAVLALGACTTNREAHFRNGAPKEGLTDLLQPSETPLHIIFLHGMRATGSGGSETFRAALCPRLPGCVGPSDHQVEPIPLERQDITYLGRPIWNNAEEWKKSSPIVHRWVYRGSQDVTVVVEEVNWWPLLLPIKCRFIVRHDAPLVGVSKASLDVCAARGAYADNEHYPWITSEEADEIAAKAGVTGGGAKLNRALKTEIMDWGLADAVIATGPMGDIIGKGIGEAFAWTATTPVTGTEAVRGGARRYVLVSESLGSVVAFDYYERHYAQAAAFVATKDAKPPADARAAFGLVQVLDNSDRLYFLANQIALLELARIEVRPLPAPGDVQTPAPLRGLRRWARTPKPALPGAFTGKPNYGQVVAFHDPSDILTFEVPAVGDAQVYNVFAANGPTYLGLLADPARAHTAYARNSCVLQIIFDKHATGPCRVAKPSP